MTITSFGYAGTIAANDVWANLQATLGTSYLVVGATDARVLPVAAGTRQVTVAAGTIGGRGILDQVTAPVTVQLPTVATGTEWFLIVARRTWGVTQATTFTYIDAGTSNATLPARNTNPGTVDDQPLALVPLTAGNTVPGTPIDLRVVGSTKSGPRTAFNQLALSYYNDIGAQVRIGNSLWTRIVNGSYAAAWISVPDISDTGWVDIRPASGSGTLQYRVVNGLASVRASLSGMKALTDGNIGSIAAAGAIPVAYRPIVTAYSAGSAGGQFSSLCYAGTAGDVAQWNNTGGTLTIARCYITYLL